MMTLSRSVRVLLVLCWIAGALPRPARADGAFPDEFSIHFPAAAPDRIIVGANFGVMISEDRGATWRYACEPYVTEDSSNPLAMINVVYYQIGAADGELFQVATNFKMRKSGDLGCTWTTSGGAMASLQAIDMFPSPTDAQFVVAIGVDPTGAGSSLLASHDGGTSFDAPLTTQKASLFSSVELSASGILYTTVLAPGLAQLWRSDDSGQTWAKYDLPNLPNGIAPQARIIAIDPEDASTAYLRLIGPPYDAVAIATGGGQAFQIALTVSDSALSAFARGTDKTLYAGTPDGRLFVRPPPSAQTPQPPFGAAIKAPHFRCLGQRFGTTDLYACGNMFQDGFSVGVSHDNGISFQKVMTLPEMQGPLTCTTVQTACAAHWARIQSVFASPDGGTGTDAGNPDAGGAPPSGGSHCSSAGAGPLALLGLIGCARRARRRRRAR